MTSSNARTGTDLATLFQRPMVERFQTRSRRRLLVVGFLVYLAALAIVPMAFNSGLLAVVLFVGSLPLAGLLNMSVRGVTEIPTRDLDERQVQLRNGGYRDAYWLGVALAFVIGLGMPPGAEHGLAGIGIIIAAVEIVLGLPAMVLAWRLPNEAAEEA